MFDRLLPLSVGRTAFGADPGAYARDRPPYPASLFRCLDRDCGVRGADLVEIGPGTGLATAPLLFLEPSSLLAIEPDPRLADHLRRTLGDDHPSLHVLTETFEAAALAADSADMVVSATAFHWLDQPSALRKALRVLRPGGQIALIWNVFHDCEQPDALHVASEALWRMLPASRSFANAARPFAMDTRARLTDLRAAGFIDACAWAERWTMAMGTDAVIGLAATFSQVAAAEPAVRGEFLQALRALMETRFGGRTERRFTTTMYRARKPTG